MESKVKDLSAYEERFHEDPASFSDFMASDYVKELKNQGKEDKAIEVGRTFMQVSPELKGYINHYGYALYNRFINIDEDKINEREELFYSILDEIAKVCKQERYSPLEAAVNRAIKHITRKTPVDYKKFSEVLDYLDAPTLDEKPFVNKEGKEFESKKEKWFRMKVRALYEIGEYNECLEKANIALASTLKWHYNNLNWVKYYRGCSLVELKRYEEAENEFLSLKDRFNAVDFTSILYKLYLNTDRLNDAYTYLIYDFFLNGFDYKHMGSYESLAAMAKEKEQKKAEELARALVYKLKQEHGEELTDETLAEYESKEASEIFDRLYSEIMDHLDAYIKREEGKVVYYNADHEYGSIYQDGEDNLFFRQADYIYDEEVQKYDVVEFSRIKTYDRKHDRASSKAILLKTLYEEIRY